MTARLDGAVELLDRSLAYTRVMLADVLPDHLKTGDIVEYVTREIDWVKGQLL